MNFKIIQSDSCFIVYSKGIYIEISKSYGNVFIQKRKNVNGYWYYNNISDDELKQILFAIEKTLAVYSKESKIIRTLSDRKFYYNINSTRYVEGSTIIQFCNSVLEYYKDVERKHFKIIDESDNFMEEMKKYIEYNSGSKWIFNELPLELKTNKEIIKQFIRSSNVSFLITGLIEVILPYCSDDFKIEVLKEANRFFIDTMEDDLLFKLLQSKDFKIEKR